MLFCHHYVNFHSHLIFKIRMNYFDIKYNTYSLNVRIFSRLVNFVSKFKYIILKNSINLYYIQYSTRSRIKLPLHKNKRIIKLSYPPFQFNQSPIRQIQNFPKHPNLDIFVELISSHWPILVCLLTMIFWMQFSKFDLIVNMLINLLK